EVRWIPHVGVWRLAFVDLSSEIELADLEGNGTVLRSENVADARPLGIVWTTPPRGTHYRSPEPAKPPVVASAFAVKSKARIDSLAADGMRLAFDTCGEVASWRVGTSRVVEIRPERPLCLGKFEGEQGSAVYVCCTTVAGSTVGYQTEAGGGIQQRYSLE